MPSLKKLFLLGLGLLIFNCAHAQLASRPHFIPPRLIVRLAPNAVYFNETQSARWLDPHPEHQIVQMITDQNKIKAILHIIYSGVENHWIRSILIGKGEWFEPLYISGPLAGRAKKINQPLALGQTQGLAEPLYYYLQKLGPGLAEKALHPKIPLSTLNWILQKRVELEQAQRGALQASSIQNLERLRELCENRMTRSPATL